MVDENAEISTACTSKLRRLMKKFLFILKDEDCLREQINFKVNFKVGSSTRASRFRSPRSREPNAWVRRCLRTRLAFNEPQRNWLDDPQGEPSQVGPFELCARNRLLPRLIQLRVIFIQIRSFSYLCIAPADAKASWRQVFRSHQSCQRCIYRTRRRNSRTMSVNASGLFHDFYSSTLADDF